MYTSSFVNVFGAEPVNPSPVGLNRIALTEDIELSWPTQFQDTEDACSVQLDVTPDANGHIITIPDARFVSPGQPIYVSNASAFSFILHKNDGTLLANIPATSYQFFFLLDNTTQGGQWRGSPFGGGHTSVTSVAADSLNNNLTITGSPITVAGTFNFDFSGNLLALSSLALPGGIIALTGANTFSKLTLGETVNQVLIANADGVGGPPTFSLDPTITGINSITVGNFVITANQIRARNADGHIELIPFNSNGSVDIYSGVGALFYNSIVSSAALAQNISIQLPTTPPLAGQVLTATSAVSPYPLGWATVATLATAPSTVNAIAKFANTGGGLSNTSVFIDAFNNISIGAATDPDAVSNSIRTGNLRINFFPNTISTILHGLRLQPAPGEDVDIGSKEVGENAGIIIHQGEGVTFNNTADTFGVTLYNNTASADYNLALPDAPGTAGQLVALSGAGQLAFINNPVKAFGLVGSDGTLIPNSHYNIASCTRDSDGEYTITFTTPLTYAAYAAAATPTDTVTVAYTHTLTNNSFKVTTTNYTLVTPADAGFSFSCLGN